MLLSKPDILEYLRTGKLRFDPPVAEDRVSQVSVDLRLGKKFTTFKKPPGYLPCINVDKSLWEWADLWEHRESDAFRFVEGRSSWARIGVTIHVTAPKIDPGFNAAITLEMANFGKIAVELRAGTDEPAQLMLPEADLYGASEKDTFQGQTDPIPHRRK